MPRMVVTHERMTRYGKRGELKVGDSFEATDKHARLFRKMNYAVDAPLPGPVADADKAMAPAAPQPVPTAPPSRAPVAAPAQPVTTETAPDLLADEAAATRRGRYARRDMRVEDGDSGTP